MRRPLRSEYRKFFCNFSSLVPGVWVIKGHDVCLGDRGILCWGERALMESMKKDMSASGEFQNLKLFQIPPMAPSNIHVDSREHKRAGF